jgi:hypothetical protein
MATTHPKVGPAEVTVLGFKTNGIDTLVEYAQWNEAVPGVVPDIHDVRSGKMYGEEVGSWIQQLATGSFEVIEPAAAADVPQAPQLPNDQIGIAA